MRKHTILTTAALTLALGLLAGCGGTQATTQNGSSQLSPLAAPGNQVLAGVAGTSNSTGDALTAEQAKQIALEDAGLSADAVTFVKAGQEYDDGRLVYEFEFYQGATEYDYEIDAATGEIRSFDQDAEYYTPQAQTQQSAAGEISAAEAKAIAFSHAGVSEADARGLEMDIDRDHGRTIYEFEWAVGRIEYSCDVDAATGAVVGFERDAD